MAKTALIVGDGLAGALLAVLLARDGWKVVALERRADPRAKGYAGGRSINLALSARGLAGLREAGLERVVMEKDAIPMRGRMIHPVAGDAVFQPYSKDASDAINSVSRGGLNLTLIAAAGELANIEQRFSHTCIDADIAAGVAIIRREDGSLVRETADLIIGADGAFSAIRGAMQRTDRFEYSQSYLEHGYKELHIPPTAKGDFALDPNALHIWPRGGAMMIALPNRDKSFTCTLFWPYAGEHSFASLRSEADVRAHFAREYASATPLMPTLVEDYAANPTSSLVTVRCWPWQRDGRFVLVGDAAHAIVPFYGQGINCGFEDCVALARALRERKDQREALEAYQAARKPNADAIADMALANFVEMRDKTGQPAFLYRKKIEQTLHAAFPQECQPQYNLVSFSTVPYTQARASGQALDRVIDEVVHVLPMGSRESLGDAAWSQRVRDVGVRVLHGGRAATHVAQGETLLDISPAMTPAIQVWPGDTPFTREVLLEREKGASVTLSTIRTTLHLGSHADGSNHYATRAEGGVGVGEMPLERYIGPCHVLRASIAGSGHERRIEPSDVEGLGGVRHPRVLLRTGTFPDPSRWNTDFAGLSVALVDALAAKGVTTIGVDTPSVDTQESKDLPAHRAIFRHGIAILEGLSLAHVEPGEYELFAQPLKLMGCDASPVRAVLRPLTPVR